MQPAFGSFSAGPTALAALARLGRVRVADRLVALVVERVVRQPALADVRPAVVVGPVGERVRLPELVLGVPAELRRVRAQRRLVAAAAGSPPRSTSFSVSPRRPRRRVSSGITSSGGMLPRLTFVPKCLMNQAWLSFVGASQISDSKGTECSISSTRPVRSSPLGRYM